MLRKLYIQNYAIIDELTIEFQPGLNIITGETGAGKSILLGALMLILGQRVDASVLKDQSKSCIVEGEFDISSYDLDDFFRVNDLDYNPTTIVRRQIGESGKSRAFINEIPVNLTLLKELGDRLIDIHSQHQNLLLGTSRFQLNVVDTYAIPKNLQSAYLETYLNYRQLEAELKKLEDEAANFGRDFDYLQHQLEELRAANLKEGELEELEIEQAKLTHATEIKSALEFTINAASNDETSAIALLKEASASLKKISPYYPAADELEHRLESCRIELRDIVDEAERRSSQVNVDDELLASVSQRIDLLYTLLQKHRKGTMTELIAYRNSIEERVNHISGMEFNLETRRKDLERRGHELRKKADELSILRRKAAAPIEQSITELLIQLGIKHAIFKVDIQPVNEFQPWGTDRVTFYFSANSQIPPMELSKIASGGELSRVMLSLKSLLVKASGLPTIIFDEIDTGVSGEIADKMGSIIHTMAKNMQVINITHLPQIAAKGKTHFLVYKENQELRSTTGIKLLTPEERVVEIAKMLSGEKVSDAAILNARELLKSNGSLN